MKQKEYSDSEFNMRRVFYERTIREGGKKDQRKGTGNRSTRRGNARQGASKTRS